jgi:hypothetical protein
MNGVVGLGGSGVFVEAVARRRRRPRREAVGGVPLLRFAFYGRMSTEEYQDRVTSLSWQREVAAEMIGGRGAIVVEFFDEGVTRRLSWWERPAAAALLEAVRDPGRGFDAVVVGEYERAFYGDQFASVIAVLQEFGVQLWLPEAGGLVDVGSPVHQALMVLLGAGSRREVVRARHRTLAAMRVQTSVQGRFLGGRPPYGYRLVDAGPHPNRAHAQWGRRLRRLDPDPATAPWVRWIFEQRAAGRSVAGIARELNERGVACASGADRERNRHRSGEAWIVRTVVGILENPRYTGRQVWDRTGRAEARDWAISDKLSHAPLVDEAMFAAVQGLRAARSTRDGATRTYVLAGLVRCGVCGRRLDAHWVNQRPGYRCRHGHSSARTRPPELAKNIYVREDHLLGGLRNRQPELVGLEDAAVAEHLRVKGLVIVCRDAAWTVGELIVLPAEVPHVSPSGQQFLPLS